MLFICVILPCLTHWGRVTHICVGKLTIIGSDNGLSPGRRQAIIRTSAGILLIRNKHQWNFNRNSNIFIQENAFEVSSAKWRPFCLGLNVLRPCGSSRSATCAVFYLKFFEHPSFGQVAHEIYPSEWKVHSSEISITIMYCWYMFLMAVATDFTHVTINLVCCCLSPVLISHKRSCWKISQSLKPIWLDVEMLVPLFF